MQHKRQEKQIIFPTLVFFYSCEKRIHMLDMKIPQDLEKKTWSKKKKKTWSKKEKKKP